MRDKLKERLANREHPLLLRLERLELDAPLVKAIEEGASIKAIYDELPLEQILMLDILTDENQKLRFVLRKERGRYSLTILGRQHRS
jgi:hypothetical protein